MTAIRMDGFGHYGTGNPSIVNLQAGGYASAQNVICQATTGWGGAPRTGTACLVQNGVVPAGLVYALPATGTHFFQSFGFAVNALAVGNGAPITEYRDGSNVLLFYLAYNPLGTLEVFKADGTLLGTTSGPAIVAENWHFFEIEVNTIANTFTVRLDDASASNTPILSVTNAAIAGTVGAIAWLTDSGSSTIALGGNLADIFVRNAAGAVNNSWLGDRRVSTLLVDQDTTTAGWTPNFYQKLGAGILNNTVVPGAAWAGGISAQNVGTGDFTIEGFVRFQALPSGSNKSVIFSKWDETDNLREYQLFLGSTALNNGSLCFQTSTDGTVSTVQQPVVYPWTPVLDQWYHIAIVRAASELLLFVNGQQFGLPIADSRNYFAATATPFGLGAQVENHINPVIANTNLQGWMDEVRLTVGFARYTANFTPTTIEFPRGLTDPEWADVAFLAGFDSTIQDESSHLTTMTASGASQQTVHDGAAVGSYSTLNKSTPDDNTFMSAPFIPAMGVLTVTVNPANNNSVRVGTKDGAVAAVYTYKTTLTGAAFEVLIDTNIQNSLQNLYNAINAGPGAGTKYGTGTTSNFDVFATQLPAGQMQATANAAGTGGNAIVTTVSGITGSWSGGTLSGGLNIPGPSNFKLNRLPPTTTLISAVQITMRAFKSDAGLGSINASLVGPLGGLVAGPTHGLTVSPVYYNDVFETDPDTAGPISPTTVTNGAIQINRDL